MKKCREEANKKGRGVDARLCGVCQEGRMYVRSTPTFLAFYQLSSRISLGNDYFAQMEVIVKLQRYKLQSSPTRENADIRDGFNRCFLFVERGGGGASDRWTRFLEMGFCEGNVLLLFYKLINKLLSLY